ncbi:MAG: hypothetical protein ABID84_05370 [Chloroflexota bacterium]
MTEDEQGGTYRALPQIDDEIRDFILQDEAGLIALLLGDEVDAGEALERIDEELSGLAQTNPNLTQVVRNSVDAIYAALADEIPSEQMKVLLRVVAYTNAFVLLRVLDMQWRRIQPP